LLAPPGDPEALSRAILAVLQDRELADSLRRRGMEMVQEYTWDHLSRQASDLYIATVAAERQRALAGD
jgi:glycosyltransferase involved in cell wall biosynthesis